MILDSDAHASLILYFLSLDIIYGGHDLLHDILRELWSESVLTLSLHCNE